MLRFGRRLTETVTGIPEACFLVEDISGAEVRRFQSADFAEFLLEQSVRRDAINSTHCIAHE